MTPLERAARAMADNLESHEENWEGYVHCVRTVLLAIREPSEGMVEATRRLAMPDEHPSFSDMRAKVGWQAMIDTALSEGG